MTNTELEHVAREVRARHSLLQRMPQNQAPGRVASAADILTYLYFEEMTVDLARSASANRDRFVLSKAM